MARYKDPVCKLCRREGEKLYLKGERCFSPKCAVERRPYAPGAHGQQSQFQKKASDYALQLRAKQKVRRYYGVLERQFRRYFGEAARHRGLTGLNLLIMLETRLDNVVYRLGFATSRPLARQLVNHAHFTVNGRKVDIPSYLLQPGDVVELDPNSRQKEYFKQVASELEHRPLPDWLTRDAMTMSGRVLALPTRASMDLPMINEQLIVEHYSR